MATVIASRLPDKKILMQHLKIEEPYDSSPYLEPFDNALLKNLNQFLEDTALKHIEDMKDFLYITLGQTTRTQTCFPRAAG
jgi:hypothetical protein